MSRWISQKLSSDKHQDLARIHLIARGPGRNRSEGDQAFNKLNEAKYL